MSNARLPQTDRYWIQVELEPSGRVTGATQIDLNMVDKVTFNRSQEEPDVVDQIEFVYAGTMKPIGFKGKRADFAYRQWVKYTQTFLILPEDRIMDAEEGKDNLIFIPHTAKPLKGQ